MPSSNALLSALTISSGDLNETFSATTYLYTKSVAYGSTACTVTPTHADAGSTIKVNGSAVTSGAASGSISLSVGQNAILIMVTAADATTILIYTIIITRAASLSVNALTTLDNVKLIGGIADTSDDALLNILIDRVSNSFLNAIHRDLRKTTYTSETYPPNNSQYLVLKNYPIVKLTSIVDTGVTLTVTTDYLMSDQDAINGLVYRQGGWTGNYLVSGMTSDIVAGVREILITYDAGYLFPADAGYSAGGTTSLPLDISQFCEEEVIRRYQRIKRQMIGLSSIHEGGINYAAQLTDESGFIAEHCAIIKRYERKIS